MFVFFRTALIYYENHHENSTLWVCSIAETMVLNNKQRKFLVLSYIFYSNLDTWDFPKPFSHFTVGKISIWQLAVISFWQGLHLWNTVCQLKFGRVPGGCPDHHLQISSKDSSPLSPQENYFHWDNFVHMSLEHLSPLKYHFSWSVSQSALPKFSSVSLGALLTFNTEQALKFSQDAYPVYRHIYSAVKKQIFLNSQERHFSGGISAFSGILEC